MQSDAPNQLQLQFANVLGIETESHSKASMRRALDEKLLSLEDEDQDGWLRLEDFMDQELVGKHVLVLYQQGKSHVVDVLEVGNLDRDEKDVICLNCLNGQRVMYWIRRRPSLRDGARPA